MTIVLRVRHVIKLIFKLFTDIYIALIDNLHPAYIFFLSLILLGIQAVFFSQQTKGKYVENENVLLILEVILPMVFYFVTFVAAIYRQRKTLIEDASRGISKLISFLYILAYLLAFVAFVLLIWGGVNFLSGLSVTTLLAIIVLILILKK